MASLVFAGVTLWNDAATGVGSCRPLYSPKFRVKDVRSLPQGNSVARLLGKAPGSFLFRLNYLVSSSESATLEALFEGLDGNIGNLVTPQRTYSRVIMLTPSYDRGDAVIEVPSTVKYNATAQLFFQSL